ncbi:unnamed protein product [Paramecium sonneborni]|uniref:Protein kinase domain-containing protein n=1 Tax=Paramecium sonneborni TaxID=65129 RepID=A0A8S1MFB6_9CILI|nr:unnamed protein product [Paramecium sonneborni]
MSNFNSQQIILKNRKLKILKQIGRGSYGNVFKVLDEKNNQKFALKIQSQIEQSEWEISKKLQMITHRNIVNIVDCEKNNGYVYFLMDCCDQDLYQSIQQQVVNQNDLRYILVSIADGINFLHMNDIIHRDLKPENILIKTIGDPKDPKNSQKIYKIADFGLSTNKSICQTQQIGTCYYMAPELIKGETYNNKVDIWSLGAIAYELITNQPLFNGSQQIEIFNQITNINQEINQQQLQNKLSVIKDEYRQLIMNMLTYDPQNRPDIKQVLVQLRDRYRSPPGTIQMLKPNLQDPKNILHNKISFQQNQINIKNLEQFAQNKKFITPNLTIQKANENTKQFVPNQTIQQNEQIKAKKLLTPNPKSIIPNQNVSEQKNQTQQNEINTQNLIKSTNQNNFQKQQNAELNINNFQYNQNSQTTNMNNKQNPQQQTIQSKEQAQFKQQEILNPQSMIVNKNLVEQKNYNTNSQNTVQQIFNQKNFQRPGSPPPQTFQNAFKFEQIRSKSPPP